MAVRTGICCRSTFVALGFFLVLLLGCAWAGVSFGAPVFPICPVVSDGTGGSDGSGRSGAPGVSGALGEPVVLITPVPPVATVLTDSPVLSDPTVFPVSPVPSVINQSAAVASAEGAKTSSADRYCSGCTPAEERTLRQLLATHGTITQKNSEYVGLDCGVVIQRTCMDVFGDSLPVVVQQALVRGVKCLGAVPTKTTSSLIREMLEVLGRTYAPQPVILCHPLSSDNMKAVGIRSDTRKQSPVIVLSPVLAKESQEYMQSVIFHEFLHLGGNGHSHGAQRELATPCQSCCFSGRAFDSIAKPYACKVCKTDYPDKYDDAYLSDLEEWANRTPGSEFIFRINKMDEVKRAGGDTAFMVEMVDAFKDHPFGFELARLIFERLPMSDSDARRVGAVARKRHGHVTKRYVPFAQAVGEATLLRFDVAANGGDADRTLERESDVLLSSRLPVKGDVARLDLPIFYKYYYEFALLRGVLADEVYGMWNARWKAVCQDSKNVSGLKTGGTEGVCADLAYKKDVFACQKIGLDFNSDTHTCQK